MSKVFLFITFFLSINSYAKSLEGYISNLKISVSKDATQLDFSLVACPKDTGKLTSLHAEIKALKKEIKEVKNQTEANGNLIENGIKELKGELSYQVCQIITRLTVDSEIGSPVCHRYVNSAETPLDHDPQDFGCMDMMEYNHFSINSLDQAYPTISSLVLAAGTAEAKVEIQFETFDINHRHSVEIQNILVK